MSLDGETNLKPKLPLKQIESMYHQDLKEASPYENPLNSIKFDVGIPDADLYNFKA